MLPKIELSRMFLSSTGWEKLLELALKIEDEKNAMCFIRKLRELETVRRAFQNESVQSAEVKLFFDAVLRKISDATDHWPVFAVDVNKNMSESSNAKVHFKKKKTLTIAGRERLKNVFTKNHPKCRANIL